MWGLAAVGGALGGISVSFTRYWADAPGERRSGRIAQEAFIGATAAFALLGIGSLGSLFDATGSQPVSLDASQMTLAPKAALVVFGGSILAGFIGRRFLDAMSKTLLTKVEERVGAVEKENTDLKSALADNATIDNVRRTVLEPDSSEPNIRDAIEKLKELHKRRPGFHPAAVLLGRAHKRVGEYEDGLRVMERFTQFAGQETKLGPGEVARLQAVGHFNAACYRSLRAKVSKDKAEVEKLLDQAAHDLRIAVVLDKATIEDVVTDPDLEFLREQRPQVVAFRSMDPTPATPTTATPTTATPTTATDQRAEPDSGG